MQELEQALRVELVKLDKSFMEELAKPCSIQDTTLIRETGSRITAILQTFRVNGLKL